ncbi:MAG: 5'/3'-nucleotidase SurE [Thermoproteota archaeon]
MNRTILLTNDDGVHSPSFKAFWRHLLDLKIGEVVAVTPEHEMSAAGKSITLHKPLRVNMISSKIHGDKYGHVYLISGTPADAVVIAFKLILKEKPYISVSGINIGDNITLDNLFTSGTIAAAIQSLLSDVPAIAFSVEIPTSIERRQLKVSNFNIHGKLAAEITRFMIENPLSKPCVLNINFPFKLGKDTNVELTTLAKIKFENYILERKDPRGIPYYWIGSSEINVSKSDEGTDLYALTVQKAISISPISLEMSTPILKGLESIYYREQLERDREVLLNLQKEVREILMSKVH